MAVRGIEYVELYPNDKQSVVDYFTAAMGFTQIAQAVDQDRESALLRQGDAQLVVLAGPGISDFLDAHGDGVVDVAVRRAGGPPRGGGRRGPPAARWPGRPAP